MVGGRKGRRLNGGGNVSGAMMWLYVGETEDSMMDAMYRKPGCGWRYERQRTLWWRQCVMRQNVAGGSRDRGLYGGGSVYGAGMWLEVGETEDCMMEAVCK